MSFFFNDTATTEIYTLSLHDALPIYSEVRGEALAPSSFICNDEESKYILAVDRGTYVFNSRHGDHDLTLGSVQSVKRSEEHTSELQSQSNLVCRLLLEKKNKKIRN